jgi:hypothetical protein
MHSTRAGGIVYVQSLSTEIHSKVGALGEPGHKGEGGKAMQKGSGIGTGEHWEWMRVMSTRSKRDGRYAWK